MNTLQKILGIGAFALLSGCDQNRQAESLEAVGPKPSEYIEGIVVREGGTLTRALESGIVGNARDCDLTYVILLDAPEGRYALDILCDSNKSRSALAESIEPGDRIKVNRSFAAITEDKTGTVWTRAVQLIAKKDQVKAEEEYSSDKK